MNKHLSALILLTIFFSPLSASSQERLIFHHIPKNGGTTARYLLRPKFKKDEIYPEYFMYNIDQESKEWYRPYKLIGGHFPFFYFKHIPGRRITFLRDPIQRILSAHQFWKRFWMGKARTFELCREFQIPFGDPLVVMENHQVRFLSGLDPNDLSIPIEKHLKSAKKNLEKEFFFFGFVEQIDESMRKLFTMLGFPTPNKIPIRNASKPETYSEETLQALRDRNQADIELYNFAKKLYKKRFNDK